LDQTTQQSAAAREVSLSQLFTGFLIVGLLGFGGLAMSAYYVIVEKRRWLDNKEFSELFAICSILPGGNIMNATIMIGARHQGALGSVVAMSALLLMPLLILIALAMTYDHFSYLPDVRAAMAGAASAAAGLIVATATKLGLGVAWRAAPIAFAVTTFVAVSFFQAPLWLVVLVIGSSSILMASRAGKRS
jgi:chromate transporter